MEQENTPLLNTNIAMKISKHYILLAIISMLISYTSAQDYKKDIEKALALYNMPNYEVSMEYKFYPSYTSMKPLETEKVWIKKQGTYFHMYQFGIETFSNKKYVLIIDNEEEILAIDYAKKPSKPEELSKEDEDLLRTAINQYAAAIGIDTTKEATEDELFDVTYLGVNNGLKSYKFEYKYGEYQSLTYKINNQTGLLEKMIIYYREPMQISEGRYEKVRVEIDYLKQEKKESFAKETFSIDSYLSVNREGKVILTDRYKDYRVINHLMK